MGCVWPYCQIFVGGSMSFSLVLNPTPQLYSLSHYLNLFLFSCLSPPSHAKKRTPPPCPHSLSSYSLRVFKKPEELANRSRPDQNTWFWLNWRFNAVVQVQKNENQFMPFNYWFFSLKIEMNTRILFLFYIKLVFS